VLHADVRVVPCHRLADADPPVSAAARQPLALWLGHELVGRHHVISVNEQHGEWRRRLLRADERAFIPVNDTERSEKFIPHDGVPRRRKWPSDFGSDIRALGF